MKKPDKIYIRMLGFVIVLLAFFYLTKSIYGNWNQIRDFSWKPDLFYISISFCLEMSVQIAGVVFWTKIIQHLGSFISLRKALKIWFISSLGRYLPGKAWQLFGMMWLLSREGVPAEISVVSSVFVQIYSIIPGIIIAAFALFSILSPSNFIYAASAIVAGFLIVLVISHPKVIGKIISEVAKKRGTTVSAKGISPVNSCLMLFSYVFYWVLRGVSFFFFIKAFYPDIDIVNIPLLISIFSASYISGLLFLLAPGGVGIREGIMLKMLNVLIGIPIGVSSAMALLNRIWLSFIEIFCLLIALAVNWRKNVRQNENR